MDNIKNELESIEILNTEHDTLTVDELNSIIRQKDSTLQTAEKINKNLRDQVQEQVENYNRDTSYLAKTNQNLVKLYRKKEDAITKIITGVLDLYLIDREEIAPKYEGGNNND